MRYLPINLDNVKNAATLFVDIFGKEPWSKTWSYSTAYARLAAEVKKVGFTGYITLDENGLPGGFLMGHTEACADGRYEFFLSELCFPVTVHGRDLAIDSLKNLNEELKRHNIHEIIFSMPYSEVAEAFFTTLGFEKRDDILSMRKSV